MSEPTVASFPTYAELTQTQGWVGGAPVPIATAISNAVVEQSQSGRYTEEAVLGIGGMGKVVLARDARIGRSVALKALRTDHDLTDEERARFLREAQVQGQLEHPSIVPVYDIDVRPDGATFFTMRRVLGKTLHAILDDLRAGNTQAAARYTQRELLQAFATVCLAIDYAHTRGVIHRDLKPANIMLGDFGEVYVLDWGLARVVDPAAPPALVSRISTPGTMMGTPLYMAPEQMADPEVGPAADVYSLGAILFEILTLQRVRDPRAMLVPVEARPTVRAPDRNVAPELETICVKATELSTNERYPSARSLQEAIARFLEGDRELEQRRMLASKHADKAREALREADKADADHEQHRNIAIRELGRALALNPTDREHVAMFAELMATPPRNPPPEVKAQIAKQAHQVLQEGARYVWIAMLSWFAFAPLVLWMGVRRWDYTFAIACPVLLTVALSYAVVREPVARRPLQYAAMVTWLFASMGLSRIFGPFIMMPTMLTAWCIVSQAHPDRRMRQLTIACTIVGMTLPVVLEAAGVLPASYLFGPDGLTIPPQMVGFDHTHATVAFIVAANLGIAVIPAIYLRKLRDDLTALEVRNLIQAWHFRRLPDDLMRAAG